MRWRGGWDSNPVGPLIPRNLLILRNGRNAENAQNATLRYMAGTLDTEEHEKSHQLAWLNGACFHSRLGPASAALFVEFRAGGDDEPYPVAWPVLRDFALRAIHPQDGVSGAA